MGKKKKKRLDFFYRLGDYEIYDDGRVYSHKTKRFLKPDMVNGYPQYNLSVDGKNTRKRAHQFVALGFIPNPDNLPMINHMNGIKTDPRSENLEWCTAYHNNKHARDTGLNDVKGSNSRRWKDPEFSEKTRKHMSDVTKGRYAGEKNPRFKYRVYHNGKVITRHEAAKIIGRAITNTDIKIAKAANGEVVELFVKHGITVENVKR